MNHSRIFKLSIRLFCVLGLIFHSSQLFYEYWQGKTIVNIKIDRSQNTTLPGITVCYARLFSFEKLSHLDQFYYEQYQKYLELLNISQVNETNVQDQLRLIYNNVIANVLDKVNNRIFDLKNIIQNYTLDFKENVVKIALNGRNESRLNTDNDPVESFVILYDDKFVIDKCFTFFSALNKKWRIFKNYTKYIYIRVINDDKIFPLGYYQNIYLSLHSPNTLPDANGGNYHFLTMGKVYTIKYSRILTRLLESNYDTNCFDYDLDYKLSNFNMRSDCITWCYQRIVKQLCNTQAHIYADNLFRKNVWSQFKNKTLEHCFIVDQNNIASIYSSCYNECPKDCKFEYYSLDVKEVLKDKPDHAQIYLEHSNMPDVTINYLPEITWLSLICNFGGLLGMWLGISILVIIEDLNMIIRALMRKISIKNTINFNFFLHKVHGNNLFQKQHGTHKNIENRNKRRTTSIFPAD